MARLISYTVVFILGFTACAVVMNRLPPYQGSPATTAPASLATYRPTAPTAAGGRYSVADAVQRVEQAVVSIDTLGRAPGRESWEDLWLRRWFGRPPLRRDDGSAHGVASGVLVQSDGYVLTNNHVVDDAEQIWITLPDKRRFNGQVVGTDPDDDLAIVKIDGLHFPTAPIGDSARLRQGEWVVAIGNPLGFGSTVTVGVVSAERDGPFTVEGKTLRHVIQTDAAINQGNSGGALVNLSGELIGINTAIVSTSATGGSIGIGFAIPINDARPVIGQLIRYGQVIRPWIGIRYASAADGSAAGPPVLGSPFSPRPRGVRDPGIVVNQVLHGSPADAAGLHQGDLIRGIDTTSIGGTEDVYAFMSRHTPGQTVRLSVRRQGRAMVLPLRLGQKPRDADLRFRR
jgi:S1-C subfamily serine protease